MNKTNPQSQISKLQHGLLLLACYLITLIYPHKVQGVVLLNEVFPAPSSGSEWIELYNDSTESSSLANWQLKDVLTTPSVIHQFGSDAQIPASGFLVIELASQKLNNSADGVRLLNTTSVQMDAMDYSSSQADLSWSRMGDGSWELGASSKGSANPQPSPSPTPTPTPLPTTSPSPAPSQTPSPSNDPNIQYLASNIKLLSFLPCPTAGQQESITLANTGSTDITITNWKVVDRDENSKTINGELRKNSQHTFTWSGYLFNNAGDSFTIKTAAGTELAEAEYTDCESGVPLTYNNGVWNSGQIELRASSLEADPLQTSKLERQVENQNNSTVLGISDSLLKDEINFSPPTTPSAIILKTPKSPSEMNKPEIVLPKPQVSKAGAISVIIGGLLCVVSASLPLYEHSRPPKTSIFD